MDCLSFFQIHLNTALKNKMTALLKDFSSTVESLSYVSDSCEKLEKSVSRLGIDSKSFINELSIKPGDLVFVSKGDEEDAVSLLFFIRSLYMRTPLRLYTPCDRMTG